MKTQTISSESKRHTLRQTITLFGTALMLVFGLSASVISPYNNMYAAMDDPTFFEGFAQHAVATIEIRVYNYRANRWDTVATTTAAAASRVFNGHTLYQWNKSVVIRDIPSWGCYMKHRTSPTSCNVPEGWENEIKFYVREVGGLDGLYTFDGDGFPCLEDQVNNGVGAYTAGVTCKSDDNPFLHLKVFPGVVY